MRKKDRKPIYHDESRERPFDPQAGDSSGKNEDHNLFIAGNTMGKRFNTSTYDNRYERKKGMRFFLFLVIFLFIGSLGYLLINPYPDIVIIYATDSSITIHDVDVNVFRKFKLKDEKTVLYAYDGLEYGRLKEKSAQVAEISSQYNADIIISDQNTLLQLGRENLFISHGILTGRTDSPILLRHDIFENDRDLLYGLEFQGLGFIDTQGADGLSVISRNSGNHENAISMARCLMSNMDYTAKRVN